MKGLVLQYLNREQEPNKYQAAFEVARLLLEHISFRTFSTRCSLIKLAMNIRPWIEDSPLYTAAAEA